MDDMTDRLAVGQVEIETGLQALGIQGQGHARVDLRRHAAGRLGEDGAPR